jgi:hypothetical protein
MRFKSFFRRNHMNKNLLFVIVALLLCAVCVQPVFAEKCKVRVTSEPAGAMFTVNLPALKFGPTPFTMEFDRGKTYLLTFTKSGYESQTIEYRADCKDVFVQLEREGRKETSRDKRGSCVLQVASNVVNAQVYLEGELRGKTPFTTKIRR